MAPQFQIYSMRPPPMLLGKSAKKFFCGTRKQKVIGFLPPPAPAVHLRPLFRVRRSIPLGSSSTKSLVTISLACMCVYFILNGKIMKRRNVPQLIPGPQVCPNGPSSVCRRALTMAQPKTPSSCPEIVFAQSGRKRKGKDWVLSNQKGE